MLQNIKKYVKIINVNLTHTHKYGLYIQKEVKIMNKYESIIIIGQNVEEEGRKALITRFTDLIKIGRAHV